LHRDPADAPPVGLPEHTLPIVGASFLACPGSGLPRGGEFSKSALALVPRGVEFSKSALALVFPVGASFLRVPWLWFPRGGEFPNLPCSGWGSGWCRSVSPNTLRSHGGSANAFWTMVRVIRRGA
jgi:hypothetical protein